MLMYFTKILLFLVANFADQGTMEPKMEANHSQLFCSLLVMFVHNWNILLMLNIKFGLVSWKKYSFN